MKSSPKILLTLSTLLLASPAAAQKVAIVDAGTLQVDGTLYRLWGIAAPEPQQLCDDGWPVGQEAIRALTGLLTRGRAIVCVPRTRDDRGVMMAVCKVDTVDLAASMVRDGMAWADRTYGDDYFDAERDARYDRRGRHDHSCELPLSLQNRLPKPRQQPPAGSRK